MNKQEQIAQQLATPIKTGDYVDINISYIKKDLVGRGRKAKMVDTPTTRRMSGIVTEIIDNPKHGRVYRIYTHSSGSVPQEVQLPNDDMSPMTYDLYKAEWVTPSTFYCGSNHFKDPLRITFSSTSIEQLLLMGTYGRSDENFTTQNFKKITNSAEDLMGKTYGGINFNPYFFDADGDKIHYQRDFLWTQEQNQLLIHSIYNGIEIGKFIMKYNSWETIEKQIREYGHGFDYDCVDGKQRYNAILSFVQNKFPDEFGDYWNDLSKYAQYRFINYSNMAHGILPETATASDIKSAFLTINFTGTPMSRAHIDYINSIKI